jgi:hypothetical protein
MSANIWPQVLVSEDSEHALANLATYLENVGVFTQVNYTFQWRIFHSGRSALAPNEKFLLVSNLFDGFDAYNLEDRQLFRSYRSNLTDNVPLPCHVIDNGTSVLLGSSVGLATIVNVTTVAHVQDLHHDGM